MIWLIASVVAVQAGLVMPQSVYRLDDAPLAVNSPARAMSYPITVPIPQLERLPPMGIYRLEQEDDRLLPDGSRVQFAWTHRAHFVADAQGLMVELSMVNYRCVGVAAICRGFETMVAAQSGVVRRFRIGFDATVDIADHGTPAADQLAHVLPAATDRLSAIVTALERDDTGLVKAAELRNILLFAGRRLPPVGDMHNVDGGSMILLATNEDHADVMITRVEPTPDTADRAIRTEAEYRIDLSSGLVESIIVRNLDIARARSGDAASGADTAGNPLLLRERRTRLIADPGE